MDIQENILILNTTESITIINRTQVLLIEDVLRVEWTIFTLMFWNGWFYTTHHRIGSVAAIMYIRHIWVIIDIVHVVLTFHGRGFVV